MENPFRKQKTIGTLYSNPMMRRYAQNPILTAEDIPYPASYAFNAGVAKFKGRYYIAPRIDLRSEVRTMANICTGFGIGDDGVHFSMMAEPIKVHYHDEILPWVCDGRLTVLEDELYLSFCFENQHSERPGIARWRGVGSDFDAICIGLPQQRNMILYPEKIDGRYMRLERPSNQWHEPFHIWYSFSPDLIYWGESELLLGCEDVPFATDKIGGGAPPIKTPEGWLLIFHAVDSDPARESKLFWGDNWSLRYTFGAALFDLDDPTQLIAITKTPLLVAQTEYETGDSEKFWVKDTLFPCGAILEDDDTLKVYYGAGDANTCMAETTLKELLSAMTPASRIAERATIPFRIDDWKKLKSSIEQGQESA